MIAVGEEGILLNRGLSRSGELFGYSLLCTYSFLGDLRAVGALCCAFKRVGEVMGLGSRGLGLSIKREIPLVLEGQSTVFIVLRVRVVGRISSCPVELSKYLSRCS